MKDALEQFARQAGITITVLDETDSTNNLAGDLRYGAGDVILAERQLAGRGQRGNAWSSTPGENLTFSVVLCPDFLEAERQFLISKTISLAVADTIEAAGLRPAIKWPNDIYIGDRKVTGILIENDLMGAFLCRTVAGIGLNVNQTRFDPSLPNPTSLALETGRKFDRAGIFIDFYRHLAERYRMLADNLTERIDADYQKRLYRFGEEHFFADGRTRERFRGTIVGVGPGGELEVRHSAGGQVRTYLFKEIEYLIAQGNESPAAPCGTNFTEKL